MEDKDHSLSKRRRYPWVAVVLALVNPAVGMLYVGRPRRAVGYLGLAIIVCPVGASYLAGKGLWPAGFSWIPIALLIQVICIVDGYRIAKVHEAGFTGPWFTTWKALAAVAVSFVVLTIAFRAFLFEPFRLPAASMAPTLVEGDQVFVSKLAFRDSSPQRGDIIVFRLPEGDVFYVKRVIGLPGELVDYEQGSKQVTINGTRMPVEVLGDYEGDAQYRLARESLDGVEHSVLLMPGRLSVGGSYAVPEGHYFVLGDNRDNSRDSRFAGVEFIPAESVVGKVTLIWWNTEDPKRAGLVPE